MAPHEGEFLEVEPGDSAKLEAKGALGTAFSTQSQGVGLGPQRKEALSPGPHAARPGLAELDLLGGEGREWTWFENRPCSLHPRPQQAHREGAESREA